MDQFYNFIITDDMGPISYYMGPVLYFGNIFDGDHDNHHGYSMAITINKISFIPVCENDDDIQNGEDGDGAIGDIIQPAR